MIKVDEDKKRDQSRSKSVEKKRINSGEKRKNKFLNNIGADGKLNKKFSKSNMNKLKEQDKMPSFTELNI